MRIVAFSGPKYCGKDTAAKALFLQNEAYHKLLFRHAMMAEGVKSVCMSVFGYEPRHFEDPVLKETKTDFFPFVEPRWPLMDVANWFRDKYGGDVWTRRWERVALGSDYDTLKDMPEEEPNTISLLPEGGWACHVMTDLRFPEELEMLERLDALILYVHRDEAEEQLRLKRESGNAMALNVSESHYELIREHAHHVVDNNGTIAQLHGQVQALVQRKYGFWGHWPAAMDPVWQMRVGEPA